jgi:hypothetical protein
MYNCICEVSPEFVVLVVAAAYFVAGMFVAAIYRLMPGQTSEAEDQSSDTWEHTFEFDAPPVNTNYTQIERVTLADEGADPFESEVGFEQPEPTFQEAWNELTAPYWRLIDWLLKQLTKVIARINRLVR